MFDSQPIGSFASNVCCNTPFTSVNEHKIFKLFKLNPKHALSMFAMYS